MTSSYSSADVAYRLGWLLGLSQKRKNCVHFLQAVLDFICAVAEVPPEVYLRWYAGSAGPPHVFPPDMSLSRLRHFNSRITKNVKDAFYLHYKGGASKTAYQTFRMQCLDLHSACAAYHNERGLDRLSGSVEPVWDYVVAKLLEWGQGEGAGEPVEEMSEVTHRRLTSLDSCKRWIKSLPGERVHFPDPTLPSQYRAAAAKAASRRRPSRPITHAGSATTAPAPAQRHPASRGRPVSAAKVSLSSPPPPPPPPPPAPPPPRTGDGARNDDDVPPVPVGVAAAGDDDEAGRFERAEERIDPREEPRLEGDDRPGGATLNLCRAGRGELASPDATAGEASKKRDRRSREEEPVKEGAGKRPRRGREGDGRPGGAAGPTPAGETGDCLHGPHGDDGKTVEPPGGGDEEAVVDAEVIGTDGAAVVGGEDEDYDDDNDNDDDYDAAGAGGDDDDGDGPAAAGGKDDDSEGANAADDDGDVATAAVGGGDNYDDDNNGATVAGADDAGPAVATRAIAPDDQLGGADGDPKAEPATGISVGDAAATDEVEVLPPPSPHDDEDSVASGSFYTVGGGDGVDVNDGEGVPMELEPSAEGHDGGSCDFGGGGEASGSNIMVDLLDLLGRLEGGLHHHHPSATGDNAHGAPTPSACGRRPDYASLTVHRPSSVESSVLIPGASSVDVLSRLMEVVGVILEPWGEAAIVGLTEEVQGRLSEREQSGAVEFDAEERDKAARLLRAMKLWVKQQLETEKARQRVVHLLKDVPNWLRPERDGSVGIIYGGCYDSEPESRIGEEGDEEDTRIVGVGAGGVGRLYDAGADPPGEEEEEPAVVNSEILVVEDGSAEAGGDEPQGVVEPNDEPIPQIFGNDGAQEEADTVPHFDKEDSVGPDASSGTGEAIEGLPTVGDEAVARSNIGSGDEILAGEDDDDEFGANVKSTLLNLLDRLAEVLDPKSPAFRHAPRTVWGCPVYESLFDHPLSALETSVLVPGASTIEVLSGLMEAVRVEVRGEATIAGLVNKVIELLKESEQALDIEWNSSKLGKASILLQVLALWLGSEQPFHVERYRKLVVYVLEDVPNWLESRGCGGDDDSDGGISEDGYYGNHEFSDDEDDDNEEDAGDLESDDQSLVGLEELLSTRGRVRTIVYEAEQIADHLIPLVLPTDVSHVRQVDRTDREDLFDALSDETDVSREDMLRVMNDPRARKAAKDLLGDYYRSFHTGNIPNSCKRVDLTHETEPTEVCVHVNDLATGSQTDIRVVDLRSDKKTMKLVRKVGNRMHETRDKSGGCRVPRRDRGVMNGGGHRYEGRNLLPYKLTRNDKQLQRWIKNLNRRIKVIFRVRAPNLYDDFTKAQEQGKYDFEGNLMEGLGMSVMLSENYSNSAHLDSNDDSLTGTVFATGGPCGNIVNWYFLFPAIRVGTHEGLAIRLFHGALIVWDGRLLRHCTTIAKRKVGGLTLPPFNRRVTGMESDGTGPDQCLYGLGYVLCRNNQCNGGGEE